MLGFAGLSAAMAFGGTVLLLSAAFSGLALAVPVIGAGFSVLAGIFAAIISPAWLVVGRVAAVATALHEMWHHWDTTKGVIWNIKNEFVGFFSWVWEKLKPIMQFFHFVPADAPTPKPGAGGYNPNSGLNLNPLSAPRGLNLNPWNAGNPLSAPVIHVHSYTVLDGRVIAHSVSKHQGNESARPSTGPSGFDTHLSPLFPDMAY